MKDLPQGTTQIVDEQMKEFDTFIQTLIYYTQDTDEPIDNQYYKNHFGLARDIVNKYTRKLIESLAEEIIGVVPVKEIAEFQRLRVKEIINSLK